MAPLGAAPLAALPAGFAAVADDDCGEPGAAPHVVRGSDYVFAGGMVAGALVERTIIFDNDFCLLRYEGLRPAAGYVVDVVYVTEASGIREQALEANGQLLHDALRLPAGTPGHFLFEVPKAAYADGQPLELKFVRRSGANAVVSAVRLWSDDPHQLPGKDAFWVARGPIEGDWLRQDRLRGRPRFGGWTGPAREVKEGVLPAIDEQLARGRSMLADFRGLGARGLAAAATELATATARRDGLLAAAEATPEAWLDAYLSARWAVRRLAFANPLLESNGLLFVRRHHPHAMHQCARRLGAFTLPGGGICVLDALRADGSGQVTCLTEGRFPEGTYGRPDLSFDARRIVFGYAPARQTGAVGMNYGGISERSAPLYATHQAGPCEAFQVWEMGLDGKAPPQRLTEGPAENSDPLYLPDGRIAFMSHRAGGLVQCGDWALAYCLFTMGRDGSDVQQITVSKDGEWDPFLLDDGTIGFTRWEYVMKFWSPIQMLWSVRPDGTNPRLIYGSDLTRTYAYPLNYAAARPVPGTSQLVCIGSAHHNTGAGPVCLVDLALGPGDAAALQRLTPVRFVETPDQQPSNGWYDCPYPLSDKYFLVSYSALPDETETCGYGIYLLDAYGGRELVYRDDQLSALFPVLIRPRRPPLTTASQVEDGPGDRADLVVANVNEGLPPALRGEARYLQVVECHERHLHTSPYNLEVGPDSGFETKTVLGTVPVEEDGSAHFQVPAHRSVFFSVLDKDFRALHTMRSVTNFQAGERTGCVGCHEGYRRAPPNRPVRALRRPPSPIEPPPWGVRPLEFAGLIQPLLDRHCTRCHDGTTGKDKAFDLTARTSRPFMGVPLPSSYYTLRTYVRHAPIFQYSLPPGTFGSRVSRLTEVLLKGHYGVQLGPGDWHLLCAWIDGNAPGIGAYETADASRRDQRANAERQALAERRGDRSAERSRRLAAALPAGERLASYLDCGPMGVAGGEGAVRIRETEGTPYAYGADAKVAEPWYDDISFDEREVGYEVTGLRPDRRYRLGFSWWDHNHAGREQAIEVTTDSGARRQVLPRTRLPAWRDLSEKPEERTVALPPELTAAGALRIGFVNASGVANAVVSEVWLTEVQ